MNPRAGTLTVGGESRRIMAALRDAGGSATLADLGAVRKAHTLADVIGELGRLELVEITAPDGRSMSSQAVALMLRSAGRTEAARFRARLTPGSGGVALLVESGA